MDAEHDGDASSLSFALSEDGRKLLATCQPGGGPLDGALLRERVQAAGFGQLFLSDSALEALVRRSSGCAEGFTLEIGEVRDGAVSVEVAADRMTVYLTVTPPQGGAAATEAQIRKALSDHQVVAGMLEDELTAILAAGSAERRLVAQGRAAVDGEDGRLECLIETVKERHPHFDAQGLTDYRDLGGIATVIRGERLMRKIPPTAGEAGENVLGQALPARPGKEAMYASQLKGACVDPSDPAILVAEISGQPLLVNNGMTVEPTVTLNTVDLSTGNITFDGSVNVTGDVHAGMTIGATGDIHVAGTVEAAVLDAGGDVVVKGGIIGHGEIRDHPGETGRSMIARVRCGASCSAHFIENASVEAGDSIMVEDLVMQSELAALTRIVVGKPGSGKGHIIGGLTEATLLVQAAVLGSPAEVNTRVMVGTNPYLRERLSQLSHTLEKKAAELDEVAKLLAFIQTHPGRVAPEIRHKAENTRLARLQEIEDVREARTELEEELELAEDAKIAVEKTVFGNVRVDIGGKVHRVENRRNGGVFFLRDGDIVFE